MATERPAGSRTRSKPRVAALTSEYGMARLQPTFSPEVGRTMLAGISPERERGRHPFAGERRGDGRAFGLSVLSGDCAQGPAAACEAVGGSEAFFRR